MEKVKNNFARAVDWLRFNGKIKNQKELAERIGTTEATISRVKNGNVKHADQETIYKFNAVFGDVINIDYLRGESDVMLIDDLHKKEINNNTVNSHISNYSTRNQEVSSQDISSMMTAFIAAKDDLIRAKDDIIATLRAQLSDKDALIQSLRQQVLDLRA